MLGIMNDTYEKYIPKLELQQNPDIPKNQYDRLNISNGLIRFRHKGQEVNIMSKFTDIMARR
jgi:hypothetical protein